MEKTRETNQRLAGLLHGVQQPRLAKEADVTPDTKTRKCAEDAAANRAKHGDKSSSFRVDHDPVCLTSFGEVSTKPLALPCRDDALSTKALKRQNRVSHP